MENFNTLKKYLPAPIKQPIFQSVWYLEAFAKHFSSDDKLILLGIFREEQFIGYGAFEKNDNAIVFLGMKPVFSKEEVTDYGDIYLSDWSSGVAVQAWEAIWKWFEDNNISALQLDYVREDSETYKIFKENKIARTTTAITVQEVAPYITLPNSWDKYLVSLDRKERKELKRKMSRLDTVKNFHVCSDETLQLDFEEFIRLHRLSDSEKHKFMSEGMKSFFWDLFMAKKGSWEASLCFLKIDGKYTSSIMSFEFEDEIYAYNSGYDSAYDFYSVGLLLHAFKIKEAVEKKKKLYDFLRGGERYKYDLGAKDLQLYRIIISRQ